MQTTVPSAMPRSIWRAAWRRRRRRAPPHSLPGSRTGQAVAIAGADRGPVVVDHATLACSWVLRYSTMRTPAASSLRIEGARHRILHAEFADPDQKTDLDPAPRRRGQRLAELVAGREIRRGHQHAPARLADRLQVGALDGARLRRLSRTTKPARIGCSPWVGGCLRSSRIQVDAATIGRWPARSHWAWASRWIRDQRPAHAAPRNPSAAPAAANAARSRAAGRRWY
jgi:hypothetical protein